jgi:hypothetical protein
MTTRFEALSDHDLSSRHDGLFGFPNRTDLAEHQTSGRTQLAHNIRAKVPEECHRRDTLGNDNIKFGLERIGVRGGQNEIHTEISSSRGADPGDFGSNECRRFTHHTEEAEAAGRAYGGHQF